MSTEKIINGYTVKQVQEGSWWVCSAEGEDIAGPFASQAQACEVAAVLQDQPPAPTRRRTV
jgi:hypothetical protein